MGHPGLRRGALAAALALLCLIAPDARAGTWTVGVIDGPAGTTRISPTAVNATNVVVGTARFAGDTQDTGFRWENGQMIKLDTAGFDYTVPTDINDSGVIVGHGILTAAHETYTGSGANALVWTATQSTSSATMTAHNLYGAYSATDPDFGSAAWGINNQGVIAGRAGIKWESATFGTSYNHVPATSTGGAWSQIPLPDTANTKYGGRAIAINDKGLILGSGGPGGDRPWLSTGGLPGDQLDMIAGEHGLNDAGHVVGRTSGTSSAFTARLWNGSQFEEIGAGQPKSMANAVNGADWAVGRAGTEYYQSVLTAGNAWLWRPAEAATPLYELAGTGWSMYSAADINEDGLIVGTGRYGGQAVGFWMAPAGLAHTVGGTIRAADGSPVAGVRVTARGADGSVIGSAVTDAAGHYELTLPHGNGYAISAEPYLPDPAAGCAALSGAVCTLNLARNRTLDFYGTAAVMPAPPVGGSGPGPAPPAAGPGGGGAGAAAPLVALTGKTTLKSSKRGTVTLGLEPFASATTVTVKLKTAGKVRAASAKKVLTLASKRVKARAGVRVRVSLKLNAKARKLLKRGTIKVVASVTAVDASGRRTVKSFKLRLRR